MKITHPALCLAFGLATTHTTLHASPDFTGIRKDVYGLTTQRTPSDTPKPQMNVNEAVINRRRKLDDEIALVVETPPDTAPELN